jgi:MFS family permease
MDLGLINAAAFLRSLGTGFTGVVLGLYLARSGFSTVEIGIVIGAGLAGAAASTILVTIQADHLGRRPTLVALSLLTAAGGVGLALAPNLPVLLFVAFFGLLNGMGTDRSALFALEQAIIPGLVGDEQRTWSLARYNLVLDAAGSLGALAAALPLFLQRSFQLPLPAAYRTVFIGYAVVNLLTALFYLLLSPAVEVRHNLAAGLPSPTITSSTKRVVVKMTALFSIDAFGGGFLTDALVAYWFFHRFGATEAKLGVLFFLIRVLNAGSHLGAAWLAKRIGLVNTMVFTHLPSSIFLICIPFAPSLQVAVVLLLLREALVEMDVPTRQSYVAAVVEPFERTFAAGITNLGRNVFWALGSSLSGFFMRGVSFGAPLVIGATLKIAYDLILYRSFRRIRPPEEREPQFHPKKRR